MSFQLTTRPNSRIGPEPGVHPDVAAALADCRQALWNVAIFSGAVNLLMLAGPLYMLQVYDRVLASRSVPTLVALSVLLIAAYAFQGIFDFIRSKIVVRSAALLDERLGETVHAAVIRLAMRNRRAGYAQQPLRDLDQIRSFLTGSGPTAIVDLPWIPIYLFVCFLIHPALGLVSLGGGILLFGIALLTERKNREPAQRLRESSGVRGALIESVCRNSDSVAAMGMGATLKTRWAKCNGAYVAAVGQSGDVTSGLGSAAKIARLLLQSGILGLGAYLVIQQELTAGAMIAASIMMGRALAPIETAIANWRSFIAARQSVRQLSEGLEFVLPQVETLSLPRPRSTFEVSNVWVAPPLVEAAILRGIRFRLGAGDVLGIIGPSGAGKTSLVRTLIGVWPAARGTIRIDGATLDQWDPALLGPYIGFAAHPPELFDGTIAENIARMDTNYNTRDVLEAARAAGAHEMILRLPHGYNTQIGEAGIALSAGQRQRVALARALYRNPFLIVLDEPFANLDGDGERALADAILSAKQRGAIVILIAHRLSELAVCDKVLVLAQGTQQAFGSRDDILAAFAAHKTPVAVRRRAPHAMSEVSGAQDAS
jgi:PrtD family type I secretion system ABC transporter